MTIDWWTRLPYTAKYNTCFPFCSCGFISWVCVTQVMPPAALFWWQKRCLLKTWHTEPTEPLGMQWLPIGNVGSPGRLIYIYIYVSSIEGITDGGRVVDASEMQEVSIFSIILKFLFYNGRFLLHKLEGWQLVNFAAGCFKQPWLFTKEVWRWMFVTTDFLTWILPSHLVSQSASEHKCHWRCVVWMSWGVIRLLSCSSSSRFAWYDLAHWGLGSYGPRTSRDKTWFQSSMAQA